MSTTVAARIDRLINDESKTKAYATLTINDTFAIHGVRLIQGKNGLFASMPSRAVKDEQGVTEYIPYANPITKEASDAVRNCLVNAYNETVQAQAELDGLLNSDFEETRTKIHRLNSPCRYIW